MDMIELRRRLLQPRTLVIGGIPVYIECGSYGGSYGVKESYYDNSAAFLTAPLDTGSPDKKSYTMRQFAWAESGINFNMFLKTFNDLSETCVDYWRTTTDAGSSTRTLSTAGRYIIASVPRALAADFYIYDDTNQRYVVKGFNVT